MSAKHTPGPWHVGAGNGAGSIFADKGRMSLESGGTTLYPVCIVNPGLNPDEDEANGHLIAAAPDLLSALRGCVQQLEKHVTFPFLEESYAAIAKAKGEQP